MYKLIYSQNYWTEFLNFMHDISNKFTSITLFFKIEIILLRHTLNFLLFILKINECLCANWIYIYIYLHVHVLYSDLIFAWKTGKSKVVKNVFLIYRMTESWNKLELVVFICSWYITYIIGMNDEKPRFCFSHWNELFNITFNICCTIFLS